MSQAEVMRALRHFCLECQGASSREVRACTDTRCALWAIRLIQPPDSSTFDSYRALRLIRRHCLNCAANRKEVRSCDATHCPFWLLRFGVHPATYQRVLKRLRAPKALRLPGF